MRLSQYYELNIANLINKINIIKRSYLKVVFLPDSAPDLEQAEYVDKRYQRKETTNQTVTYSCSLSVLSYCHTGRKPGDQACERGKITLQLRQISIY